MRKLTSQKELAGHTKHLRGPHVARLPRAGQPWSLSYNFVKILSVIFDDRLSVEKHFNSVVSTCYANLRNLGRIASKLGLPYFYHQKGGHFYNEIY